MSNIGLHCQHEVLPLVAKKQKQQTSLDAPTMPDHLEMQKWSKLYVVKTGWCLLMTSISLSHLAGGLQGR